MAGIDRRGFIAGLGALLGTTALVNPQLPPIEVVTSTMDLAGAADQTVYWLANDDFYILRSQEEPISLFEALRDYYTPSGPIFKGEIGRYLGISFVEPDSE